MIQPRLGRTLLWVLAGIGVGTLCVFFPRFLAFLEVALRELRYIWWLVLLLFVALYLFFGSKQRD